MQLQTTYEVKVLFSRSTDGTGVPSTFVPLYWKRFTSIENYDDCWRQIENHKRENLNQGVISTKVLNTQEITA
jgi:hypothetical protein